MSDKHVPVESLFQVCVQSYIEAAGLILTKLKNGNRSASWDVFRASLLPDVKGKQFSYSCCDEAFDVLKAELTTGDHVVTSEDFQKFTR